MTAHVVVTNEGCSTGLNPAEIYKRIGRQIQHRGFPLGRRSLSKNLVEELEVLWSDVGMLIQFVRSIWFAGLVGFILWTVITLATKSIALRWLKRSSHHPHWVDSFVAILSPVLNIVIVVGGIAIVTGFMPIPAKWQNTVSMVLQAGMVLVLAVSADRLVMLWMRREAGRFMLLGEGY